MSRSRSILAMLAAIKASAIIRIRSDLAAAIAVLNWAEMPGLTGRATVRKRVLNIDRYYRDPRLSGPGSFGRAFSRFNDAMECFCIAILYSRHCDHPLCENGRLYHPCGLLEYPWLDSAYQDASGESWSPAIGPTVGRVLVDHIHNPWRLLDTGKIAVCRHHP
jgi:hypothetical protein